MSILFCTYFNYFLKCKDACIDNLRKRLWGRIYWKNTVQYSFIFYRNIKDKSLNRMNAIKYNIDGTIVSSTSIILQWYINYSSVKCQLPTYQQSKNTQETQCTCFNIKWTEWYILSVTTVMWTLHGD